VARLSSVTPDTVHARMLVQGELAQFVARQALTQAFQDVFFLIAVLFLGALAIIPFCKTVILSDQLPVEAH
jgi:DHA2 family multidrug resistance protein